ncbi:hypothetical protein KGD83_13050 [Nocardiopsis akebiae]|uniref:Uncharacterized protein n=1 Tax=Nocardiopsis akebiae TaxID=2831968 RepID=A0ABX8CFF0_9ACTN|nr:hypothetical protein [Nocardiopsis akebiae]QUX31328.1 hypothetical protein KGD83_13050 [Nocardiopsis akebiae]
MSAHTPPRAAHEPPSFASGPPERPGRAERASRRAGRPKPPWHTERPDRREAGERAQAPGGHGSGVAPELAEEYARIGAASEEELAADLLALTATHEGRDRDLLLSWAATALRFGERMAEEDENAVAAAADGDSGVPGPAGVARTAGSTAAKGGSERPQGSSCDSDTSEVPNGPGAPGATGSPGGVSAPGRAGRSDPHVEERAVGGLRPGEVLLAEYLHRARGDRVVVYADALDHAHRVARDAGWGRDLTRAVLRETALAHERAHRMLHEGRGRALRRALDHVLVRLGPLRLRGHVVGADEIAAHAYARRRAGSGRSPIALTAAIAATLAHRDAGHDRPAPRTSPGERP